MPQLAGRPILLVTAERDEIFAPPHYQPRLAALPVILVTMVVPVARSTASTEPRELVGALKRAALIEVWWALLWTVGLLAPW